MAIKGMLSEERAVDSSDNESTQSDEGGELKRRPNGLSKNNTSDTHSTSKDTSQDSDSDSSSSTSQSVSSTASKRKAKSSSKTTSEPSAKRSKTSSEGVRRVEASQYVPPRGYSAVSVNSNGHNVAYATAFENLKGKQVWHISAPANISLSKIRSIDLSSVLQGGTVLEHSGTKFTMTSEKGDDATTILIPDSSQAGYTPSEIKISKSLFVREQMDTTDSPTSKPADTNGTGAVMTESAGLTFYATQAGAEKKVRKQPENLKARYIPFGVPTSHQSIHDDPKDTVSNTRSHDDPLSPMSGVEENHNLEKARDEISSQSPESQKKKKTSKKSRTDTKGTPPRNSQIETPSSVTKTSKEKKSRNETELSTPKTKTKTKTTHHSPVSENAASMPASSTKRKKAH